MRSYPHEAAMINLLGQCFMPPPAYAIREIGFFNIPLASLNNLDAAIVQRELTGSYNILAAANFTPAIPRNGQLTTRWRSGKIDLALGTVRIPCIAYYGPAGAALNNTPKIIAMKGGAYDIKSAKLTISGTRHCDSGLDSHLTGHNPVPVPANRRQQLKHDTMNGTAVPAPADSLPGGSDADKDLGLKPAELC